MFINLPLCTAAVFKEDNVSCQGLATFHESFICNESISLFHTHVSSKSYFLLQKWRTEVNGGAHSQNRSQLLHHHTLNNNQGTQPNAWTMHGRREPLTYHSSIIHVPAAGPAKRRRDCGWQAAPICSITCWWSPCPFPWTAAVSHSLPPAVKSNCEALEAEPAL